LDIGVTVKFVLDPLRLWRQRPRTVTTLITGIRLWRQRQPAHHSHLLPRGRHNRRSKAQIPARSRWKRKRGQVGRWPLLLLPRAGAGTQVITEKFTGVA